MSVRERPGSTTSKRVTVLDGNSSRQRPDYLVTEEPLEIRLSARGGGSVRTVAVTMRTPGADFELAAGFLHTEGLIGDRHAIRRIAYCVDPALTAEQRFNTVTVELAGETLPELSSLDRYGSISSACGVCGKASLDAIRRRGLTSFAPGVPTMDAETLYGLPGALRAAQRNFSATGGLHGAGLFSIDGHRLCVREDVGRHNAVDKVIGWALLQGDHPRGRQVLVVSGRAGFEIVQKAVAAGIAIVCAVSAPSSLAVDLAAEFGVSLVGFLRGRQANVYAGHERIRMRAQTAGPNPPPAVAR